MFWANFIRLCNSVGKTPNGVASELGIPSGSITAWKNGKDQGKRPRDVTLYKIAEYFGVTPEELLQDEKKKPPVETEGEYDKDEDFKAFSKVLGDLTPEELQKVLSYAEFVLKQRNP